MVLTLCVTNECNLRCPYCFEDNKTAQNMTLETAIKAMETFKPTNISFFGGEPLLNWPVIKEVVEKYPDVHFGLTTNLTLITDEMIDFFDEHNVSVMVSLDGLPAIHNKNRCKSYDLVEKNILKLISKCKRLVEVRMTVLPEDLPYLFESIKHIHSLGVQTIIPVPVTDVKWDYNNYKELFRQIKMVYEWVINTYDDTMYNKNLTVKFIEDFIFANYEQKRKDRSPCGFGSNEFHAVGPDGKVWPCHQRPTKSQHKELCLGTLDNYRANIGRVQFTCEKCSSVTCRGWCPSEVLDNYGVFDKMPQAACMWNRINEILARRYQQCLLNSKNIRSHKLNVLKWNIKKQNELHEILSCTDQLQIAYKLADFYSDIKGNKKLLLENFGEYFYTKLEELKNRCLSLENE